MAEKDDNAVEHRIHPVVLSGGSGTRLWPMSREDYPKQLLPLVSARSLLQDTVARVADPASFEAPMVICNDGHRFIIGEQLRAIGVTPDRIVLEPVGRNTAPAAAVAALMLEQCDPSALMLVLPSDHVIADPGAFRTAVATAARGARAGALVTFGVPPDRPHTGYGYIRRGGELDGRTGCFAVERFVEKPDAASAGRYIADGAHLWNSGMFLFAADAYLMELERLDAAMLEGCRAAVAGAKQDLDFVRLAAEPFGAIEGRSIDYAVMEHTERAAVVPAEMGWSDVGSWDALWEAGRSDGEGNVVHGAVALSDVRGSYVRSEGPLVTVHGLDDVIIVAANDAVLALPRGRAEEVRDLVDRLKAAGRPEAANHQKVYRPWGFYQSIHEGERFQVKRITVNPGRRLSLQKHLQRAEHWVVVNGVAEVTRGDECFVLSENESTYIPPTLIHRLANPGKTPLNLIEIQSGGYLGEDDIIRFEDSYGRE